jgi:hypothetical protein
MANEDVRSYGSNSRNNRQIAKLRSDEKFMARYLSNDNSIRNAAIEEMNNAAYNGGSQQIYNTPSENDIKGIQKQINTLMKDKAFLEKYQSNDPKVRAKAVNELNSLFEQAYGNSPVEDKLQGSAKYNDSEPAQPNARQGYTPENPYISSASENRNAMREANRTPSSADWENYKYREGTSSGFATEIVNRFRQANNLSGPGSGNDTGTSMTKDRSRGWDG